MDLNNTGPIIFANVCTVSYGGKQIINAHPVTSEKKINTTNSTNKYTAVLCQVRETESEKRVR